MIADLMEFYGIWPRVCFTEVLNILKLSVLKQLGFVFVSVSILVFSCIFKITVDVCSKELGLFFSSSSCLCHSSIQQDVCIKTLQSHLKRAAQRCLKSNGSLFHLENTSYLP